MDVDVRGSSVVHLKQLIKLLWTRARTEDITHFSGNKLIEFCRLVINPLTAGVAFIRFLIFY